MSAEPAPDRGADRGADLDQALRALADANRRAILAVVRSGPRSVGEIAEEVGLSQQVTSHHLGVLRAAGLASGTRAGARHLFAVNTDGLAAVRAYLDGFWPARLAALKAAVESREGAAESRGRGAESRERAVESPEGAVEPGKGERDG